MQFPCLQTCSPAELLSRQGRNTAAVLPLTHILHGVDLGMCVGLHDVGGRARARARARARGRRGRAVRKSTCCTQATSTDSLSARLLALLCTTSRYWPACTSARRAAPRHAPDQARGRAGQHAQRAQPSLPAARLHACRVGPGQIWLSIDACRPTTRPYV